jgi:hypothetical protein
MAKSKPSLARTASELATFNFDSSSYLTLSTLKQSDRAVPKSVPNKSAYETTAKLKK